VPKAIEQLPSGLIVGHAVLGLRDGVPGSVRQEVHDGDTINVQALGSFGVRFLGVDAPEISFTLPGTHRFVGLGEPAWADFLDDPFAAGIPPLQPPLIDDLVQFLRGRTGPGTAANQYSLARLAEEELEAQVAADVAALGAMPATFEFFLAFSHEVMDRYGRLLCFINRSDPSPNRPLSYNERLLQAGRVTPYIIWPNTNPFRQAASLRDAVIPPGEAKQLADADSSLRRASEWTRDARQNGVGVFDPADPLRILPFEVRFLARRTPPDRWVIDLSASEDVLHHPQRYFEIPHAEDRLFVPDEYAPLFAEGGWRLQHPDGSV
jgi:endonuclease YncB( thermonuclease family)